MQSTIRNISGASLTIPALGTSNGTFNLDDGQAKNFVYNNIKKDQLDRLILLVQTPGLVFPTSIDFPGGPDDFGFTGATLPGLEDKNVTYTINGQEPMSQPVGTVVFSILDNAQRIWNGATWSLTNGGDFWELINKNYHQRAGQLVKLSDTKAIMIPGAPGYSPAHSQYSDFNVTGTSAEPGPNEIAGDGDDNFGLVRDEFYDLVSEQIPEIFDLKTKKWTAKAPMPSSHGFGTAAVLPSGKVLVIGGVGKILHGQSIYASHLDGKGFVQIDGVQAIHGDPHSLTDVCHIYDPATDSWSTTDPIPCTEGPAENYLVGTTTKATVTAISFDRKKVDVDNADGFAIDDIVFTGFNIFDGRNFSMNKIASITAIGSDDPYVGPGPGTLVVKSFVPATSVTDSPLTSGATTVNVTTTVGYPTNAFPGYPDTDGVIKIGSEEIAYASKTSTSFTGCTRGVNSTTPASHAASSAVTLVSHEGFSPEIIFSGGGLEQDAYNNLHVVKTQLVTRTTKGIRWNWAQPTFKLNNGKILVVGGDRAASETPNIDRTGVLFDGFADDNANNHAWLYDEAAAPGSKWTETADAPSAGQWGNPHGAVMTNGQVLIVGTAVTSDVFLYNPTADTWATKASMPSIQDPEQDAFFTLVFDSANAIDDNDLVLDNGAPGARDTDAIVAMDGNKVLVAGGFYFGQADHGQAGIRKSCIVYDLAANTWTRIADLPGITIDHPFHPEGSLYYDAAKQGGLIKLDGDDNNIYFVGGSNNQNMQASAAIFHLNKDDMTWEPVTSMPMHPGGVGGGPTQNVYGINCGVITNDFEHHLNYATVALKYKGVSYILMANGPSFVDSTEYGSREGSGFIGSDVQPATYKETILYTPGKPGNHHGHRKCRLAKPKNLASLNRSKFVGQKKPANGTHYVGKEIHKNKGM